MGLSLVAIIIHVVSTHNKMQKLKKEIEQVSTNNKTPTLFVVIRVEIINFNIKPFRVGLCVLPLIFCKEKERKSIFDLLIFWYPSTGRQLRTKGATLDYVHQGMSVNGVRTPAVFVFSLRITNKKRQVKTYLFLFGTPTGNRTPVLAVRGLRLNRLTMRAYHIKQNIILERNLF